MVKITYIRLDQHFVGEPQSILHTQRKKYPRVLLLQIVTLSILIINGTIFAQLKSTSMVTFWYHFFSVHVHLLIE